MLDIFQLLADTPAPNLVILVGLLCILLSFVGKVGPWIDLPPKRQKWSGFVGGMLLVSGIGLFLLSSGQPVDPSSAEASTPITSEVTPASEEMPTALATDFVKITANSFYPPKKYVDDNGAVMTIPGDPKPAWVVLEIFVNEELQPDFVASAVASSTWVAEADPAMVLDGNTNPDIYLQCWREPGCADTRSIWSPRREDPSEGAWIRLNFDPSTEVQTLTLYQARPGSLMSTPYNKFSMLIKDATIELSDGSSHEVTFSEDERATVALTDV